MEKNFKIFLVFGILLTQLNVFGITVITKETKTLAQLTPTTLLSSLTDPEYLAMSTSSGAWKNLFDNYNVANKIFLSVDHNSVTVPSNDFTYSVKLLIYYDIWDEVSTSFKTISVQPTLSVEYKFGNGYKDRSFYQIVAGGLNLRYRVLESTLSPATTLGATVKLDISIETQRFYKFDENQIVAALQASQIGKSVQVNWQKIRWAEEYDLEWTHINDYTSQGGINKNEVDIDFTKNSFKFNSTRITTTSTSYTFPQLYESGYIAFRVRGVTKSKSSNYSIPIYGKWSDKTFGEYTKLSAFVNHIQVTAHQPKLNWQQSITYAEDAKSKAVISYFDGSLRNRQTVSRINSDNNIIVGETIYDHQGRPAIQVLPVPLPSISDINFQPAFNLNNTNKPYSKLDFDLNTGTVSCFATPSVMDSIAGASKYYSSRNGNMVGINKYLPRAYGYPFNQTLYTPDNTGRIRAQSGVGRYHTVGSGHETQYFYGSPLQTELDRLFGTEAGYAANYKKNMVIDPNGQVSVSYLDAAGKVVATSLAGASPDNVVVLSSNGTEATRSFSSNLLYKTRTTDRKGAEENQDFLTKSKTLTKEFIVTTPEKRKFSYSYTGGQFNETCINLGTVQGTCFDCVVEVKILLTDRCGNNYLVGMDRSTSSSNGVVIGEDALKKLKDKVSNLSCTPGGLAYNKSDWETEGTLGLGSYTLSKVLAVNQSALDLYAQKYVDEVQCLTKLETFVRLERSRADTIGCKMTCDTCFARLGSYDKYNVDVNPDCDPCFTYDQYNLKAEDCKKLCENKSQVCENAYNAMMNDVSPVGQYGGIYNTSKQFDPGSDPLSIFNENNVLKPGNSWRNPTNPDSTGLKSNHYLSPSGVVDYVEVRYINGNYVPRIISSALPPIVRNNKLYVFPEQLASVADFVNFYWKDSYARSLVHYHPEYPNLAFCIATNASNEFDRNWGQVSANSAAGLNYGSYSNGISKFLLPIGSKGSPELKPLDPYFDKTINTLLKDEEYDFMKNSMLKFNTYKDPQNPNNTQSVNIWQSAYGIIACPFYNPQGSCQPGCFQDISGYTNFTVANPSTEDAFNQVNLNYDRDELWNMYKNSYLSLKLKVKEETYINYMVLNKSYNACIGDTAYDPSTDPEFKSNITSFLGVILSTAFDNQQPCSENNYTNYATKTPRFPLNRTMQDRQAGDLQVCYADDAISPTEFTANLSTNTTPSREPVDCAERTQIILDKLADDASTAYYIECGQCPVAKDLESFVRALFKDPSKSVFAVTNTSSHPKIPLQCTPTEGGSFKFKEFSTLLKQKMGFAEISNNVYWNTVAYCNPPANSCSPNGPVLSAALRQTASNNALTESRLILRLHPSYSIRDNAKGVNITTTLGWGTIREICCIKYTSQPTQAMWAGFTPASNGSFFKVTGSVLVSINRNGSPNYAKIEFEGYVDFNLIGCPVPTICENKPIATNFQSLFNAMVATVNSNIKTSQGTSLGLLPKLLSAAPTPLPLTHPMYKRQIQSIGGYLGVNGPNTIWDWSGVVNSSPVIEIPPVLTTPYMKLSGNLRGYLNVTTLLSNIGIDFYYDPVDMPPGASFENIISWGPLRPDKTIPNGGSNWFTSFVTIRYKEPVTNKVRLKGLRMKIWSSYALANCFLANKRYSNTP